MTTGTSTGTSAIGGYNPWPQDEEETVVRNLGNGVYEDDQGYYVMESRGGFAGMGSTGGGQSKRYITQYEADSLTQYPSGSGAGGGGGGVRPMSASESANVGMRGAELAEDRRQADAALAQRAREHLDSLAAQQAQLDEQIRVANRELALSQQNLTFLKEKEGFAQRQDERRLALETQGQLIQVQQHADNLNFSIGQLQFQRNQVQAQIDSETAQFNASMAFNVQQANAQAKEAKATRLQGLATDIGILASDPGDRGKLASFALANSGWGQQDAALAQGESFITDESLTPLESLLRGREDVMSSPDNPYSHTAVQAPQVGMPDLSFLNRPPVADGAATGTGASSTAGAGLPNDRFIGPGIPNPNYNPDAPGSGGAGETADEIRARLIVEGGSKRGFTADSVTDAEKLTIPDWALKKIPGLEDGGVVQGAYISGESTDGKPNPEVNIPDYPVKGMTTVIPASKITPAIRKHMAKFETGGVFSDGIFAGLGTDRTRSQNFLSEAVRRARAGTPFATGTLPTPVYASSPGFDPVVAELLASLNQQERGLPSSYFHHQRQRLAPTGMQQRAIARTA